MTESDLTERIRSLHDHLTPQQQAVAGALLERVRDLPFLSVPELASLSGASEATVVRFAQRLGYAGFAEMRTELLDAFRARLFAPESSARGDAPPAADDDVDDTLATVAQLEIGNIEKSAEELDRDTFRKAALAIVRADHVFTFGMGISSHLSCLLAYLLGQIGVRATPISANLSSPLEALVTLRATDLVVVFSLPPYSAPSVELVRRAADKGIPTLAVTDCVSSPAGLAARLTLPIRSENLMFTHAFAGISVLVNALTTEVGLRSREHAREAVSSIADILESDPGIWNSPRRRGNDT